MKLADNPKAYTLTPPERLTGVRPVFDLRPLVKKDRLIPEADYTVLPDPFVPERDFVKHVSTDPETVRFDLENDAFYPRYHTIPKGYQGEVSVIDAMINSSAKGGGGVKQYYNLWDDDVLNDRINVSTLLSPRNEVRRPVNMLNYLLRRPEAGRNIRLYEDVSQGVLTPNEYDALSIEEKIGYLAQLERMKQLELVPPYLLKGDRNNVLRYSVNPRQTVIGVQSLERGDAVSQILDDLRRGANVEDAAAPHVEKVLFKKNGGLAMYAKQYRAKHPSAKTRR